MNKKALFFWSSGKDSALALYRVQREKQVNVVGLVTTFASDTRRIPFHGIHETLVERQSQALGIPLQKVYIPPQCPDRIYKERLKKEVLESKEKGVETLIFGDLFLEDIKTFRDHLFQPLGFETMYPLWGETTSHLAEELWREGFKAILTCIDARKLPLALVGQEFNRDFIKFLPDDVDPCGENGEFHTFVIDAPNFNFPIPYQLGKHFSEPGFEYVEVRLPDGGT